MEKKQTGISPATQKQIDYLIGLGVHKEHCEDLDIEQAAAAIAHKLKQREIERRTPTPKQIKLLKKLGATREDLDGLDRQNAAKLIGIILAGKNRRKEDQRPKANSVTAGAYYEETENDGTDDELFDHI